MVYYLWLCPIEGWFIFFSFLKPFLSNSSTTRVLLAQGANLSIHVNCDLTSKWSPGQKEHVCRFWCLSWEICRKLASTSPKEQNSDARNDIDYIRQHQKEQQVCTWPQRTSTWNNVHMERADEGVDVAEISLRLIRALSFSWVRDPAWCSV